MAATSMNKLTMENIRCFSRETIELRPLTILLGENSTGKTTTLGCHQTTLSLLGETDSDIKFSPFNQIPHEMGNFNNIVRVPNTNTKRIAKSAREICLTHELGQLECKSWYVSDEDEKAEVKKILLSISGGEEIPLELRLMDEAGLKLNKSKTSNLLSVTVPRKLVVQNSMNNYLRDSVLPHLQGVQLNGDGKKAELINKVINKISNAMPNDGLVTIPALKPKSKRFYEFTEGHEPLLDDKLPYLLFRLWQEEKENYKKLIARVNDFGKASKAFDNIEINTSYPNSNEFEITAERGKIRMNIHDFGTGIWPALVQLFIMEAETMHSRTQLFHLQHLEEHAHPRLHAEFIKFLCKKVRDGNNFILETHSDYDLMRLTIEICNGNINAEDIAVAYFEFDNVSNRSTIHNLRYNDRGIIVDSPDCFREFYYDETEKYVMASNRP